MRAAGALPRGAGGARRPRPRGGRAAAIFGKPKVRAPPAEPGAPGAGRGGGTTGGPETPSLRHRSTTSRLTQWTQSDAPVSAPEPEPAVPKPPLQLAMATPKRVVQELRESEGAAQVLATAQAGYQGGRAAVSNYLASDYGYPTKVLAALVLVPVLLGAALDSRKKAKEAKKLRTATALQAAFVKGFKLGVRSVTNGEAGEPKLNGEMTLSPATEAEAEADLLSGLGEKQP